MSKSLFNKVVGLKPAFLSKKIHRCVHVNFAKYLRMHFYKTPPEDCF